jgi:uncharacterized membrane protein YqjE
MSETTVPGNATRDDGFFAQLRSFLASLSGYLHARLALLGIESKEAVVHYIKMAACLAAACFALIFGYIFLVAGAVMLVAFYAGWPLRWVVVGASAVHFLLALVAVIMARVLFSVPQFEATLAEFQKDRQWLK